MRIGTLVLLLSAVLAAISNTNADPDLWGHLRFGLDILQAGHITRSDPYSYLTAGQQWVNHEWLSEVLFALAWKAGSAKALVLLKVIVGLSMAGILYADLSRAGFGIVRAGILLLLAFLPMKATLMTVRPHMFTSLLFFLTVLIISRAEQRSYRWLWALPPFFALWANLHGGFLAGMGIVAIWTLGHLILHRDSWTQILLPVAAGMAATCINPYGFYLLRFLLKTATVLRPEVTEWQPLHLTTPLGFQYLILLSVCAAGLALSRLQKQPVLVFLFGVIAITPLLALRHLELFPLAALALCAPHIKSALERVPASAGPRSAPSLLAGGLAGIAGVALVVWALPNLGSIRMADPEVSYPRAAVDVLKRSGATGNLAVDFNWGEYVIWHLGPGVKVSVDGRRETVYSSAAYDLFLHFNYGSGRWDRLLTDFGTDMVLVGRDSTPYNLVSLKTGWKLIYQDDIAALFAHNKFAAFDKLKGAASLGGRISGDGVFP